MSQNWICAVTIDVEADALRSRLCSHHILASMQVSLQAKLEVQILFQHSARKLPGVLLEFSLTTGPNFLALKNAPSARPAWMKTSHSGPKNLLSGKGAADFPRNKLHTSHTVDRMLTDYRLALSTGR